MADAIAGAAPLVDMPVEALGPGDETGFGKAAVDDADRVVGVERGDESRNR